MMPTQSTETAAPPEAGAEDAPSVEAKDQVEVAPGPPEETQAGTENETGNDAPPVAEDKANRDW